MLRGVLGALGGLATTLVVLAMAASCDSGAPNGLASNCSINSDCDSPLICAFGLCHEACTESRDCPAGDQCIFEGSVGVCQLSTEKSCKADPKNCGTGLTCGKDGTCHNSCIPSEPGACQGSQICSTYASAVTGVGICFDAFQLIEAGVLDAYPTDSATTVVTTHDSGAPDIGPHDATLASDGAGDGGSEATTGGGHDGGAHDAAVDVVVGNPCANNPQTVFGPIVTGDSNAHFTSGVGLRTATDLLLLSGYAGPNPGGFDAGADAGGVGLVYAQAFDASTAAKLGPAAPLFQVPYGPQITVEDAAVASSGEVVVLVGIGSEPFGYNDGTKSSVTSLFAAFLAPEGDAGKSGLSLKQLVAVETYTVIGQPHAVWSTDLGVFLLSWEYVNVSDFLKVRRFLPSGAGAGGDTDTVPTRYGNDQVAAGAYDQSAVGVSAGLLGVPYRSNGYTPALTLLDVHGNEAPSPLEGANAYLGSSGAEAYVAIAGTNAGLVCAYETGNGVTATFVSTAASSGFLSDAGDAALPALHPVNFPGGQGSIEGRAISDRVSGAGGAGGAGMVTLYNDGVSFTYFSTTGAIVSGPGQVIAHAYSPGDELSLSNFGGSFGVALFSSASKSTQMAVSGCTE